MTKSIYKTKQRDLLVDYLKTSKGSHITVNDACDFFAQRGMQIGKTTVYRHLERMVDEGVVNKYIIDSNSPACFEYINQESECGESVCFHCKCEKCGKLIHMHCQEMDRMAAHIMNDHQFIIDPKRTVLWGLCAECMVR